MIESELIRAVTIVFIDFKSAELRETFAESFLARFVIHPSRAPVGNRFRGKIELQRTFKPVGSEHRVDEQIGRAHV